MKMTFADDYVNFEAELIDAEGQKTLYTIKRITESAIDEIQEYCATHDNVEKMAEKKECFENVAAAITGKDSSEFEKYSYRLLRDFSDAFLAHVKEGAKKPDPPKESESQSEG